jgi:hypothetical protein
MSLTALLQAVTALAAVLGLILLAGRAARSRGLGAAGDPQALRLSATVALDARRRLHLVHAPGGAVLVLTGGANDAIVAWPPTAPVP